MIADAIGYLKESDQVWKTSIVGGILLLFGFLLIPLFVVWGYVIRVLERTASGDDEAPVFEDWGDLTVDGAKAFAILLAYALAPLALGAVLFASVWLSAGAEVGSLAAAGMFAVGLLTVALTAAAAYTVPAALANFAETRRIAAGFDAETLRPVLSSGTYAVAWLLSLGIVVVGGFVAGALAGVPFLGAVLGAIVTFYALVTAYAVIGRTWGRLHPVAVDDSSGELPTDRPAV